MIGYAVPESTEPGRGRKWGLKRIAVTTVALVVVGFTSTYLAYEFELITAPKRAEAEDKAADTIESKKDPFAWRMNPQLPPSEPWESWEIDRKLTPAEEAELRAIDGEGDKAAVWKLVQRLEGRRVRGYAASYDLQLTSEREQTVLVTGLSAQATKCWTPKVKTRISVASGGTEPWEEVHFDLKPDMTVAPAMTWERSPGTPEYEAPESVPFRKAVSLSKTQTPGLLSVTPYLMTSKDCEWKIDLDFNVNSGDPEKKTIFEDSTGKKLVVYGMRAGGTDDWTFGKGAGWIKTPAGGM
ncbi:hypothetical protein ABZ318_15580 [Streptomyces sp. NPDC006197]|uniref:hypothetical protein n=1 Tax=Streptomyces sp. NPDC006197 TaxID=3156685 RepID=UPI0033B4E55C